MTKHRGETQSDSALCFMPGTWALLGPRGQAASSVKGVVGHPSTSAPGLLVLPDVQGPVQEGRNQPDTPWCRASCPHIQLEQTKIPIS